MKKQQKSKNHKTLVRLGVFAVLAIMGLTFMFQTSQQINAQVSLVELNRERINYKTDFNPCQEIKCAPGVQAQYAGKTELVLERTDNYGGNMLCKCPDGRTITTRSYTPKRF